MGGRVGTWQCWSIGLRGVGCRTMIGNLLTEEAADVGPAQMSADVGSWSQESPIGKAGRVITATRGENGPGEVELEIRGGVEVFIARSPQPLPKGAAVICVSILGPRSVIVLPWADPKDSLLDLSEGQ